MSLPRIRSGDLELARKIHHSLLPSPFEDERVEFAYSFDPIEGVGGDYCHVGYVENGRIAINVSDVTGHGVAAALLVARVSSYVQGFLAACDRPRDLVESLNAFLCGHFAGIGVFLTFYAALYDPARRELVYAGAGHPPAILVPPRGRAVLLESKNPILGVAPMEVEEEAREVPKGSLILALTDGVFEARNGRKAAYGLDRLVERAVALRGRRASEVVEALRGDVRRHARGRLHDDALLLAMRVK